MLQPPVSFCGVETVELKIGYGLVQTTVTSSLILVPSTECNCVDLVGAIANGQIVKPIFEIGRGVELGEEIVQVGCVGGAIIGEVIGATRPSGVGIDGGTECYEENKKERYQKKF